MKHIIGYILAALPLYAASQVHGWIAIPLVIVSIWFFGYVMFSDWFNDRIPDKSLPDTTDEIAAYSNNDSTIIVECSNCSQKLRVPSNKIILLTCAKCSH
jgi:hypothetical protein